MHRCRINICYSKIKTIRGKLKTTKKFDDNTFAVGNTTTYGHYLATGAPSSVTDAKGNKTTYGYNDSYTRLLGVSSKPNPENNTGDGSLC